MPNWLDRYSQEARDEQEKIRQEEKRQKNVMAEQAKQQQERTRLYNSQFKEYSDKVNRRFSDLERQYNPKGLLEDIRKKVWHSGKVVVTSRPFGFNQSAERKYSLTTSFTTTESVGDSYYGFHDEKVEVDSELAIILLLRNLEQYQFTVTSPHVRDTIIEGSGNVLGRLQNALGEESKYRLLNDKIHKP